MRHFIKHLSLVVVMFLSATFASAQSKALEGIDYNPDSIFHYYIFTGDSTYDRLPNEMGAVKPHRNKTSKLSRLIKKAAGAASTGALVGGMTGGIIGHSAGAVATAGNVMNAAGTISTASDVANSLAGVEGQDITFKGKKSSYVVKSKKGGIRILLDCHGKMQDPIESYRVVRFFELDGDRRVQWGEYKATLLGSKEAYEHGFIGFTTEKYDENRYVIIVPENQLKSGEYGIFASDVIISLAIPVGTFSIK